ncbi:hypothetical protein [Streptacidiphilus fuscans]|uniref:hypothetical protein n=1 Tax=Streptacidiphilus fuscans TaxID=2789292 RepID=UPI001C07ED3F|nr:hypothetical protein [Streptacidiphilus fuscans]
MRLREVPTRLVVGAFVFHSGWSKWNADQETADALHSMAAGAYPPLDPLPADKFTKVLSVAEMAVGTALLTPFVPTAVAGAGLTGFSGALLGVYFRTPGMRQPGSIWPTHQGIALAKDSWMFAIGLGLLADAATRRCWHGHAHGHAHPQTRDQSRAVHRARAAAATHAALAARAALNAHAASTGRPAREHR